MESERGCTINTVPFRSLALVAQFAAASSAGCTAVDGFTAEEWALLRSLERDGAATADPSNAFADDPAAQDLGHRLFFDERLSAGGFACSHCHQPTLAYADDHDEPTSTATGVTSRNAPSLLDLNRYTWFHWDGKADSVWQAITFAAEVSAAQDANRVAIAHLLRDDPEYDAAYTKIFGDDLSVVDDWSVQNAKPGMDAWETMGAAEQAAANRIYANFAKALAAHVGRLTTGPAPLDAYLEGDGDLSDAAKRGAKLFVGEAGCIECHSGPELTDDEFHNLGVSENSANLDGGHEAALQHKFCKSPFGRCGEFSDAEPEDCETIEQSCEDLPLDGAFRGTFRTPSLRNVELTAPYMHTGARAELSSVVEFYVWGGDNQGFAGERDDFIEPLALSDADVRDLVAFLETLTSEDLPPEELNKAPN